MCDQGLNNFYPPLLLMKKIFWTTVFWLLVLFLFRSYMRLFNHPLGLKIGSWFGKTQQVCVTTGVTNDLNQQFDALKAQLDTITQKLQSESQEPVQTSLFQTTAPTKVALYYFNQITDQKLPPEQQANVNSLLPVYRLFPASKNLLVDAINELLKGSLTASEIQQWFTTEFPNTKFQLLSANIVSDGTLTLNFSEVPWFTDGGSARMLILAESIKKTALQFPAVKKVVFVPETLFQP